MRSAARLRAEREADWWLPVAAHPGRTSGRRRMDHADARDLAAGHRRATTSLAIAGEISLDRALLDYTKALTARAHPCVCVPQARLGGPVRRFFTASAPQALRRSRPFILIGLLSRGLI
ncbi:hypothetical protein [Tabrizicola thermarum]|uniref:hypothetical protein n=1 Tax=Tabrizicola thermarum TaxID=2670345 RepID=UPI000FFC81E1|nr:hypothetical protein [Tabrizicola thermarum]